MKVLFISNIANNAYINAKIMHDNGVQADVLCNDYYDAMSYPEWEDPGQDRPKWFAQGPLKLCLKYLLQKNQKKSLTVFPYWFLLSFFYRKDCVWRRYIRVIFFKIVLILKFYFNLIKKFICFVMPYKNSDDKENINNACLESVFGNDSNISSLLLRLIKFYDIVQIYGISPVHLYLVKNGCRYIAYEHGTIRDIPFQEDMYGKLCRLVYCNAQRVFVTNTDCVKAARKLNIEEKHIIALPHAFYTKKINKFRDQNNAIKINRSPYVFFAPARHQWTFGSATWRKGNDLIVRAVKNIVDVGFSNFKVCFVEWGNDYEKTKSLINDLGVSDYIIWSLKLPKELLWLEYLRSIAVIDQFVMPAIGGVGFEVLALGKRLITRLDVNETVDFFSHMPPVYNALSIDDIAKAMMLILEDPDDAMQDGKVGIDWIQQYHSSEVIFQKQIVEYENLLKDKNSIQSLSSDIEESL